MGGHGRIRTTRMPFPRRIIPLRLLWLDFRDLHGRVVGILLADRFAWWVAVLAYATYAWTSYMVPEAAYLRISGLALEELGRSPAFDPDTFDETYWNAQIRFALRDREFWLRLFLPLLVLGGISTVFLVRWIHRMVANHLASKGYVLSPSAAVRFQGFLPVGLVLAMVVAEILPESIEDILSGALFILVFWSATAAMVPIPTPMSFDFRSIFLSSLRTVGRVCFHQMASLVFAVQLMTPWFVLKFLGIVQASFLPLPAARVLDKLIQELLPPLAILLGVKFIGAWVHAHLILFWKRPEDPGPQGGSLDDCRRLPLQAP